MSEYDRNRKRLFPWKKLFTTIKQRCNNPNSTGYEYYGGKGIKCQITEEELKKLWFRDKAYLMKKPSVDRKNSDKNYIFDNCQIIELNMNSKKAHNTPILQFDLDGNFIKEWRAIIDASKTYNIHYTSIICCCKGKTKTSSGFKWRYKNDK